MHSHRSTSPSHLRRPGWTNENAAREKLLSHLLGERRKPAHAPQYPLGIDGAVPASIPQPRFPGDRIHSDKFSAGTSIPLPYTRNPHFVGRASLLASLREHFSQRSAAPILVSGGAGFGKTQLVLEYCYQLVNNDTVIWIDGSSPAAFNASCLRVVIALKLSLPGRDSTTQLFEWLEAQSRWTLVIDALDDPDMSIRLPTVGVPERHCNLKVAYAPSLTHSSGNLRWFVLGG